MKYRNLDVLRALAVILVFLQHVWQMFGPSGPALDLARGLGRMGVILFFFHTSFVLMQSIESLGTQAPHWKLRFYVRRAFRIYPMVMVIVLLVVLLHIPHDPWSLETAGLNRTGIILNMLLLQNLGRVPFAIDPLWSLPIEIQMYVVLPFIFLTLRMRHWKWIMTGMWLAVIIALPVVHAALKGRLNLINFIPCFLCGPIGYKLSRDLRPSWRGSWWILVILAVSAIGALNAFTASVTWLLCLVLALAFPYIRDMQTGWLTSFCHLVAKYSYGIYLIHVIGLWISFQLIRSGNPVFSVLIAIAITSVASIVSFHVLEDPLIRIGKNLSDLLGKPRLNLDAQWAPTGEIRD